EPGRVVGGAGPLAGLEAQAVLLEGHLGDRGGGGEQGRGTTLVGAQGGGAGGPPAGLPLGAGQAPGDPRGPWGGRRGEGGGQPGEGRRPAGRRSRTPEPARRAG